MFIIEDSLYFEKKEIKECAMVLLSEKIDIIE